MFREALARAGGDLPGCLGAALVGRDGMVVDQWTAQRAGRMDSVAAEVTAALTAVHSVLRDTRGGALTEVILRTSGWFGVVRAVGDGYFLVLLASPGAPMGRARFVLERAVPQIETELV